MSATDSKQLKDLHDTLLAAMPEGAQHDPTSCVLCAAEDEHHHTDTTSGGLMPETYTQDDLDAAVSAGKVDLQKRLDELEAQAQQSEVGKAVADAVAERETRIGELQNQLDAAQAAKTAAESSVVETTKFWDEAILAHELEVQLAARRDERVAKAKESGIFDEEYILANADRFAAMSDDDFASRIDEWRLIASKAAEKPSSGIPATTALTAARSADADQPKSALQYVSGLAAKRIDINTLSGGAVMASYGRNFHTRISPSEQHRRGRFQLSMGGASIPIGAPVTVAGGATPVGGLTGALPATLATGAQAPKQGFSGIGIYEYTDINGLDPQLYGWADQDKIPDGELFQVISGTAVKVVFNNTADRKFLGLRDYKGRVMVAGLGATPTVAVGDFLSPGPGTDAGGYWIETGTAANAWLIVTNVDASRQEVEAQMAF